VNKYKNYVIGAVRADGYIFTYSLGSHCIQFQTEDSIKSLYEHVKEKYPEENYKLYEIKLKEVVC
jgi:hypothetical protein